MKHGPALLIRQEVLCTMVNLFCVNGGVGGEAGATWSGAGLSRAMYSFFGGHNHTVSVNVQSPAHELTEAVFKVCVHDSRKLQLL